MKPKVVTIKASKLQQPEARIRTIDGKPVVVVPATANPNAKISVTIGRVADDDRPS